LNKKHVNQCARVDFAGACPDEGYRHVPKKIRR
jgi:hypothetical protein